MIHFLLFLVIFTIILIYFYYDTNQILLEKNFYEVTETYPYLYNIYKNLDIYKHEFLKLDKEWFDWVEKDLYKRETKDGDWKIIPFYGFNIWVEDNCKKCPEFTKFLKSIPNLKVAILSKMGSNTVLSEHRGWANLSNYVLRCHFGLNIPDNCYVSVGDYQKNKPKKSENIIREVKKYEQDKWIIFDDSKFHYTWNKGNKDRIVLILDIDRPKNIKRGNAIKGDTKELTELLKTFKKIKINHS